MKSTDFPGNPLKGTRRPAVIPQTDPSRPSGRAAMLAQIGEALEESELVLKDIPVEDIVLSPYQPRLKFDQAKLMELRESIKAIGLGKPIIVRPRAGGYELVGGERRLRAVKELGWKTIPAVIKSMTDSLAMIIALSDNTGEALTDYESALGYARVLETGEERSQGAIAARLGINRSTISRCLQLVELPGSIQSILKDHPELITSNYAKQFVEYAKQDRKAVERVVRALMVDKGVGQVAALREIGKKLRPASSDPVETKSFQGLGTVKRTGTKVEFRCEKGIDPSRFMQRIEAFLASIDPQDVGNTAP